MQGKSIRCLICRATQKFVSGFLNNNDLRLYFAVHYMNNIFVHELSKVCTWIYIRLLQNMSIKCQNTSEYVCLLLFINLWLHNWETIYRFQFTGQNVCYWICIFSVQEYIWICLGICMVHYHWLLIQRHQYTRNDNYCNNCLKPHRYAVLLDWGLYYDISFTALTLVLWDLRRSLQPFQMPSGPPFTNMVWCRLEHRKSITPIVFSGMLLFIDVWLKLGHRWVITSHFFCECNYLFIS